ncbi:hypothetical protein [Escherichia coli]|uniref:hypothetical protein n=1 Tax=Escherichia coli TaxID=562 RepID=UPI002035480F|nr:hypothetical protein [Escherichia coli]
MSRQIAPQTRSKALRRTKRGLDARQGMEGAKNAYRGSQEVKRADTPNQGLSGRQEPLLYGEFMKMGKIAVTPNNDKAASHSKDENLATNTIKKNVKPKYGDAAFLEYTRLIVNHPNYFGMPDPFGEKGEIQWEAPSNRASGKFKHTHQRRYEWWKNKARSIGIDPDTEKAWISKTAKLIHPLGVKPCKKCGKEMELSYSYPNEHFFSRVRKLNYIDETFELSQNEHIVDLLTRLDDRFGERIYLDLPHLFSTKSITI